jgi:6,7-dimethyl-8-ribityllumazine synthase
VSGAGRPSGRTLDAAGLRLAIIGARWHQPASDTLGERAQAAATACGAPEPVVLRVEGAWELPVAALALAGSVDAVVAVGCILRGGTPHFEHLCRTVYDGLARVALQTQTPVGNGVLACDTPAQAADRAGGPGAAADKGWEATLAALDLALSLQKLNRRPHGVQPLVPTTSAGAGLLRPRTGHSGSER